MTKISFFQEVRDNDIRFEELFDIRNSGQNANYFYIKWFNEIVLPGGITRNSVSHSPFTNLLK